MLQKMGVKPLSESVISVKKRILDKNVGNDLGDPGLANYRNYNKAIKL